MKMKSISMDLQQSKTIPVVEAVQGDIWSRDLEVHLFSNKEPYRIPENTAILIRYRKADRTGGEYDTLPDGSPAWKVRGNVLTITLSDQALTFPGQVMLTVSLIWKEKQLNSFPIELYVYPNAHTECAASEDYFNFSGFLVAPWNAALGQYLRVKAVNAEGRVTEVEAVELPAGSGGSTSVALVENEEGVLIRVENGDGSISSAQLRHGADGYTPVKGVDYFDGADGRDGIDGQPGADGIPGKDGSPGADGYTPVKGVDYWTETEKASIIQEVIAALGTPVFGTVDAENNIILSGNLAEGSYTLKYEDGEGNHTEIGTIVIGDSFSNLADPESADWLKGSRVNSSLNIVAVTDENQQLTNIIPLGTGANQFHIKGMNIYNAMVGSANYCRIILLDENKNIVAAPQLDSDSFREYYSSAAYDSSVAVIDVPGVIRRANKSTQVMYVRFGGYTLDSGDVFITCDENIV